MEQSAPHHADAYSWQAILRSLRNGTCVLFLGPAVFRAGPDSASTLEEEFIATHVAEGKRSGRIRAHYEDDGLLLFERDSYRGEYLAGMERFYRQDFSAVREVLEKIARIRFRIIFQLTPDELLLQTFQRLQLPFLHDCYEKKVPYRESFTTPSAQQPLLYHLLGYLQRDNSMVLTHKDLFEYIESLFEARSMHPDLKADLKAAQSFIFLGLPFEKWYMQLLFRMLALHSDRFQNISRYASDPMRIAKRDLFERDFNIEFIPNEAGAFVDALYALCEEEQLLKPLPEARSDRPPPDGAALRRTCDRAADLIARTETERGIALLKEVLAELGASCRDLRVDLRSLEAQYHQLHGVFLKHMQTESDERRFNRLINSIFLLIEDIKACIP